MASVEKPLFKSAYYAFAHEWREQHSDAVKSLSYIEVLRRIASDWSLLTPVDKIIYWDRAGVTKSPPQLSKKKKGSLQKSENDYDIQKSGKKKSKSITNLSTAGSDDSSDSDSFVQQKRKYRKRDKSNRNGDNDSYGNYGRRRPPK